MNPNAIHLLEDNPNKVRWDLLSFNSAIFTYDYELIKKTNMEKNACVYHPRSIEKYINEYGIDALDDYMV